MEDKVQQDPVAEEQEAPVEQASGKKEKSKLERLKDDARPLVDQVREFRAPDILKIPKPNPMCHYRWARNESDNLTTLEAQGFRVANSEEVRKCGLTPAADGAAHRGDLILCLEDWAYFELKNKKKENLARRRMEQQQKGYTREKSAGVSGKPWHVQETVREG